MTTLSWWLPELQEKLSQGDIVSIIPVGILTNPPKFLKKGQTFGNNRQSWMEQLEYKEDNDGKIHFLANGKMTNAIVLSHDCDLDKSKRVLIAPIASLETLQQADQEKVLRQNTIHHMGLPNVPSLGNCYVDFRSTSSVPTHVIASLTRLASMTPESVKLLQAMVTYFYTRKLIPD